MLQEHPGWSDDSALVIICGFAAIVQYKGGSTEGNNSTLVPWEITIVSFISSIWEIKRNMTLSVIVVLV